nr:hypothetical protein [Methylobacterium longum]
MALIRKRLPVLAGIETVPFGQADGRVLAEVVVAPLDLPPFDNGVMDGYAVRAADCADGGATHLPLSGRIQAGRTPTAACSGVAVRIFTGAPMHPAPMPWPCRRPCGSKAAASPCRPNSLRHQPSPGR